ncbi:hypothetical protein KIW84_020036 [Lathyrus oleraceus]|uniref:Reticulon-like protein n=1 Tax=Pisum sativum TaxID=3888 RepID=A0A9D4Y8L3_PEA|nr:hypothetical protein KIW84_020036 [Pisum sativum]
MLCLELVLFFIIFCAANLGCILEDFVRWHSPPDWTDNEASIEDSDVFDSGDPLLPCIKLPNNVSIATCCALTPSKVPLAVLEEAFVNITSVVGNKVNSVLWFLQNVSCEGNWKPFLIDVASLWAGSGTGSGYNFFTVIEIAIVAAHILPSSIQLHIFRK